MRVRHRGADEIRDAMQFVLCEQRLVVEGGGAVPIAVVLHDKVACRGGNVALTVSGGHVDRDVLLGLLGD